MALILSTRNFFNITCFILLYFSIFSHPTSIIEIAKNPVNFSSIPYIIFITQFFFFLREWSSNILYLKNNNKSLLVFALFISQLIGFLNAYLNNKLIFNQNNVEAIYYLTSASAYILLLFNNRENYNFLSKANIIQIIILLLILLTFLFNSKSISYGAVQIIIKLELLNFEKLYIANSNGLGRISAILALTFFTIFIYKKKSNFYFFIIATIFGGVCFAYEGKFNTIIFVALIIYLIVNSNYNYKNKIYLFIFFIFSSTLLYLANYNYKKNLIISKDADLEIRELKNIEYNTSRILNIQINNDLEIISLIRAHPNYNNFEYIIENKFTKKINDYLTGRVNKFIYFSMYNQNFLLGTGPMSDRAIANLNDYKTNNDSASAITYTYLTSGILGLIILFYLYYKLIKIFFNQKIKIPLNIIFIKSVILLILMRSLIENSFTVWGIDFSVLVLSIITIEHYCQNISKNNS
jgi:hypothetical protein